MSMNDVLGIKVSVNEHGVRNALVPYDFQPLRVACDGKCHKAWGFNNRPRIQLSETDADDFAWKSDHELGKAPANPGTYESGESKPQSPEGFPNKWCVRECERCFKSRECATEAVSGDLPDFSRRLYNKTPHTRP